MRSRLVFGTILTATLAFSVPALANPSPQDIAQARELGAQAQGASEAGNYAESEKLWQAASNLYPAAPTLVLGLARTQAKLGKFVAAQESYNRIIREQSRNANPPPAFKDALDSAQKEVGAVSAKVANVVITVEGGAQNPTVTIDGQPVSAAGLGLKRPVDPGSHTVRAEAQGFKPGETTFQVSEAGNAEAKLKLEKKPDAPPPPVVAGGPQLNDAGSPAQVDTKKSSNKTLAIVALGVGGAGLVFGGITGILALGKHGNLKDKCPNDTCPASAQSDVDGYKTMGTLSTIGFIVGGVGVAAGAILWFTAPKETTSASAGLYMNPTGAGFTGQF